MNVDNLQCEKLREIRSICEGKLDDDSLFSDLERLDNSRLVASFEMGGQIGLDVLDLYKKILRFADIPFTETFYK